MSTIVLHPGGHVSNHHAVEAPIVSVSKRISDTLFLVMLLALLPFTILWAVVRYFSPAAK